MTVKRVVHPGWKDTLLRWYNWLYDRMKNDEETRRKVEHQQLVSNMIKSADGGTGHLHNITKPNNVEKRCRFWRKKKMSSLWPDVRKRGKNGQNIDNVMRGCKT